MGLWEYTQQGKGGEWSEWTKLRPCSCNNNNSKSLRLFVDQKLRISFSLIINFAYLWNFGVSPRYALAGVLQLPINLVAACRISARLPAPSPCLCHSGSWPLSDTRNQNTERRRGWSWGFSARAEGGGGEGGVDDVWWHFLVLFKGIRWHNPEFHLILCTKGNTNHMHMCLSA